jgi:hypothetical protein
VCGKSQTSHYCHAKNRAGFCALQNEFWSNSRQRHGLIAKASNSRPFRATLLSVHGGPKHALYNEQEDEQRLRSTAWLGADIH